MKRKTTAVVLASPQPPNNGGNGVGQSGHGNEPAYEHPASCQSPRK